MRAVQVAHPKAPLEIVEREIPEPGPGSVRIKVQACGICHSDTLTKEGTFPLVPAQFHGGVLRLAIDVMRSTEFASQGLLVFTARDRNRPEPRSGGELDAEMAPAAEAEYGDELARPRTAVAEAVRGRLGYISRY
jgi:hypothetical protein